jgi:hypothetical protein
MRERILAPKEICSLSCGEQISKNCNQRDDCETYGVGICIAARQLNDDIKHYETVVIPAKIVETKKTSASYYESFAGKLIDFSREMKANTLGT